MTRKSKRVAVFALSAALTLTNVGLGIPTVAYADETSADLQAKLDQAQSHLDELYAQAEQASEKLNDTQVQLDQTKADIEQTESDISAKQEELKKAQQTLSERVAANYKSGGTSLLDIVLNSSDFASLANNIYYAQKVSKSDEEAISAVQSAQKELTDKKAQLEQQKSEQESLLATQKDQKEALAAQAAEAEDYVNSLDAQVKQKMQEEQEAARKAAEEQAAREAAAAAAAAAQVQNNSGANAGGGSNSSSNSQSNSGSSSSSSRPSNGGSSSNSSSNSGSSSSNNSGSSSSSKPSGGSSVSAGWRSTVVSAAYSMVGGSYVWGAYNPGGRVFDCSGLTKWCYAQAGISISHSSGSQSAFCNKPASQAEVGDVVWYPGHVGIYIGGGQTIEAMSPSQGIRFGSLSSFQRAGSPV